MTASAKHDADMMGALERQSRAAKWQKRRRDYLSMLSTGPPMWQTNEQNVFLIKLLSCLIHKCCVRLNNVPLPVNRSDEKHL